MKTTSEILLQQPIFLNDWADKKEHEIIEDFQLETLDGVKVLFASYAYELYEGDAWLLCAKDDVLYEVDGSHCSCYGLEGQWDLEEVFLKELKNRITKGNLGLNYKDNVFQAELKSFLGIE